MKTGKKRMVAIALRCCSKERKLFLANGATDVYFGVLIFFYPVCCYYTEVTLFTYVNIQFRGALISLVRFRNVTVSDFFIIIIKPGLDRAFINLCYDFSFLM